MRIFLLAVVTLLGPVGLGVANADSDGYYCAGRGYLAYQFGMAPVPVAPHRLYVLRIARSISMTGNLWRPVLFTLCISTAAAAQAPVAPQPLTIDGAVTHVYKSIGQTDLRLHVFAPSGERSARRPAIVFFFGGAWTNGNIGQFVPQSQYLAGRGMVAIVADYRVYARHATSPFEAIADAKSAIRWVRAHAKELHIDPSRIAAGGGSSGGHLALSAAVLEAFDQPGEDMTVSSKPNALVLFNPAVDTTHDTPRVLGERFAGRGAAGSPRHHVRRGIPPVLIFHGKADATVPYADVERFCVASRKLGNQCELLGYEEATHGFFNPARDAGRWYRETLREMDRFLVKLGYLSGPATARP